MSSSAQHPSNHSFSAELASLYECIVCYDYITPPILQCSNGHMVCSNCRQKLNSCPLCQGKLGISRNLALERVISYIHFPCKFLVEGCQTTMLLMDKITHEVNCKWRPCSCPCCNWQGSIGQVLPHFLNRYSFCKATKGGNISTYSFETDSPPHPGNVKRWVGLQNFHDHHFFFLVKKERKVHDDGHHDRILVAVQLIGTKEQARKFAYTTRLRGFRQTKTWEATPLSIHDTLDSAALNKECMIFESADDGQLSSQNGNLVINVKIDFKFSTLTGCIFVACSWLTGYLSTCLINNFLCK